MTTTTVFADMVQQVGGTLVQATSLVPKGGDVHTFEPRPADVTTVAQAKLLVMNGLGLDDWLTKAITNASANGTPLVQLGRTFPGLRSSPGEDPGTQNPHLWMDVKYGELYVDRIAAALAQVDPANAATYSAQASAYKTRLEALDASVRQRIATIPEANRKLVTFHDAFPYYAREYGITIVGVAVEAPGQDPSAGYTADLITAIKAAGVKAIFSESQFPTKLVDQLETVHGRRPPRRCGGGKCASPGALVACCHRKDLPSGSGRELASSDQDHVRELGTFVHGGQFPASSGVSGSQPPPA